jgi:phytoene dehydrogenase-like protein
MNGNAIAAGAGPVGFLTALGLARSGIRVTLLETEAGINGAPRSTFRPHSKSSTSSACLTMPKPSGLPRRASRCVCRTPAK